MLIAGVCLLALSACDSKQAPVEVVVEEAKPAEPTVTAAMPEVATPAVSFHLETAIKQSDTFESLQKRYGETNVI